jgi:hypothetical protein
MDGAAGQDHPRASHRDHLRPLSAACAVSNTPARGRPRDRRHPRWRGKPRHRWTASHRQDERLRRPRALPAQGCLHRLRRPVPDRERSRARGGPRRANNRQPLGPLRRILHQARRAGRLVAETAGVAAVVKSKTQLGEELEIAFRLPALRAFLSLWAGDHARGMSSGRTPCVIRRRRSSEEDTRCRKKSREMHAESRQSHRRTTPTSTIGSGARWPRNPGTNSGDRTNRATGNWSCSGRGRRRPRSECVDRLVHIVGAQVLADVARALSASTNSCILSRSSPASTARTNGLLLRFSPRECGAEAPLRSKLAVGPPARAHAVFRRR